MKNTMVKVAAGKYVNPALVVGIEYGEDVKVLFATGFSVTTDFVSAEEAAAALGISVPGVMTVAEMNEALKEARADFAAATESLLSSNVALSAASAEVDRLKAEVARLKSDARLPARAEALREEIGRLTARKGKLVEECKRLKRAICTPNNE